MLEWPDSLPPPPPRVSPGALGLGADQELWSCPSNPMGLVRRPSQPWACPPGSPRQDRSSITPSLALVTPFRSPFVTPETQPACRGCHRKSPHTTGLAGPLLPWSKAPISPLFVNGRDPHSEQASCCWLETTAPSLSVIRVQQGLGSVHRQPWGASVLDQMQPQVPTWPAAVKVSLVELHL